MGMHGYRYGFEFAEPMQHCTHFHGVTGMHRYSFQSGEWSYDLVDSLMTLLNSIQTNTTIPPPTTTVSNCSQGGNGEQGWQVSNHNSHSMAQMM